MTKPLLLAFVPMFATAAQIPGLDQLTKMTARFAPTEMRADTSSLSAGDKRALAKLIEAARVVDDIFMTQLWSGNHALRQLLKLDASPLGKARLHYFLLNKGPWSDLEGHTAFLPGVPDRKPPGANFYPEDMTREEFEKWVQTLSKEDRDSATGFFTVIRRDAKRQLTIVPSNGKSRAVRGRAAGALGTAALLTDNATLKNFLAKRAKAFLTNDY